MPYEVKKRPQRKDGKQSWYILWAKYGTNKHTSRFVSRKEWPSIGFNEEMTLEEARALAKSINTEANLKRLEEKRNNIQEKLTKESKVQSIFLPRVFVDAFEREWIRKQDTKANLNSHWRAAKRVLASLELHPNEWANDPTPLFREFTKRKWSLSYSEKLLRIMNEWGIFISKKTHKFFIPVKPPKGKARERIRDAYFESKKKTKKSVPITPEDLAKAKSKLQKADYNWVWISLWFGLRPAEVDNLTDETKFRLEEDPARKLTVLWVYQPKLSSLPRDERWKLIPVLYKEQKEALRIVREEEFKRPLVKTLEAHLKPGATPYAGRKGFHALMSAKGNTFEDISAWMGHRSLDRTWLDYVERLKVSLKKRA